MLGDVLAPEPAALPVRHGTLVGGAPVAGMVRISRAEAISRIAGACCTCPDVAAAYLFGSALGEMRPDSDIDVGVVLGRPEDETDQAAFRRELQIEGELEARLGTLDGHRFEVTILHPTVQASFFVVNALQDAVIAYIADQPALTTFIERVAYLHRRDGRRHWAALAEVTGWDPRPTPRA